MLESSLVCDVADSPVEVPEQENFYEPSFPEIVNLPVGEELLVDVPDESSPAAVSSLDSEVGDPAVLQSESLASSIEAELAFRRFTRQRHPPDRLTYSLLGIPLIPVVSLFHSLANVFTEAMQRDVHDLKGEGVTVVYYPGSCCKPTPLIPYSRLQFSFSTSEAFFSPESEVS